MKKVNLGCGPTGKDDWINLDWGILAFLHRNAVIENILLRLNLFPKGHNIRWPINLKLWDCRRGLPFKEESIDYIYTSHFIEHLKKFEAERLLKDCYRVLKKGGVLRLVIPDLEILLKKYAEKDAEFFMHALGLERNSKQGDISLADLFMGMFYPDSYRCHHSGINKLKDFFVRPHLWMYNVESAISLLKSSGFEEVQQKRFREGKVPDLDILDIFSDISLHIEATK